MKRVIYILTLALILLGLLVPVVSHAGNGDRSEISACSKQNEDQEPVLQNKSVANDFQIRWTLRSFLGTVFQALNWHVSGLYVHGSAVMADDQPTESDRPFLVQRPTRRGPLEKSDRPDTDDDGWEERHK